MQIDNDTINSLVRMRAEMHRLTTQMLKSNRRFLAREAVLMDEYRHDEGTLQVRMRDDIPLGNAAGAARTCAILASACSAVIQAELTWALLQEDINDAVVRLADQSSQRGRPGQSV